MLNSDDREYYARRIETELRLAREAKDPGVRKIHLALAAEYRLRAAETADQQKPAGIKPSMANPGVSGPILRSM